MDQKLKIALFGHGRVGKLIEKAAKAKEHQIGPILTSTSKDLQGLGNVDVCIDFSVADAVVANVKLAAKHGKNIVIGTTGWQKDLPQVKEIAHQHQIGVIYSPNFSLGVLLFFKIVKEAAKLIGETSLFDAAGVETHHRTKKDAPSGTAIALAATVQPYFTNSVDFGSVRVGTVPGTHSLIFDSFSDEITLTHVAKNKEGFAEGALLAAHWLTGKKGFYQLEDML